jgi:hypothetical protein
LTRKLSVLVRFRAPLQHQDKQLTYTQFEVTLAFTET